MQPQRDQPVGERLEVFGNADSAEFIHGGGRAPPWDAHFHTCVVLEGVGLRIVDKFDVVGPALDCAFDQGG